jgi:hypothetical protein
MSKKRTVYGTFVGKSERMRPLGRPRSRWVYNISMDLGEIRMVWHGLHSFCSRRALVNTVLNLRIP